MRGTILFRRKKTIFERLRRSGWNLELALELLAGEPVVLSEERETVWALLGGRAEALA
jgi:hypothetical protein